MWHYTSVQCNIILKFSSCWLLIFRENDLIFLVPYFTRGRSICQNYIRESKTMLILKFYHQWLLSLLSHYEWFYFGYSIFLLATGFQNLVANVATKKKSFLRPLARILQRKPTEMNQNWIQNVKENTSDQWMKKILHDAPHTSRLKSRNLVYKSGNKNFHAQKGGYATVNH